MTGIPLSQIQRKCQDCGAYVERGTKHKCRPRPSDRSEASERDLIDAARARGEIE